MTRGRQILIGAAVLLGLGLIVLQFNRPPVGSIGVESGGEEISAVERAEAPVVAKTRIIEESAEVELKVATGAKATDRSWLVRRKGVAMPLVFQQLDAELLHLNPQQVAVIEQLRASFIKKIGGTNQSPDDPIYLEKWQEAQPESDAMLWLHLGKDIYQQAQLQAFASAAFASRAE